MTIDYNELDKYFTGYVAPVIENFGGIFVGLGEPQEELLYKIDEDYYTLVKNDCKVRAVGEGEKLVITENFVVTRVSLKPASPEEIEKYKEIAEYTSKKHTQFVKRFIFNLTKKGKR